MKTWIEKKALDILVEQVKRDETCRICGPPVRSWWPVHLERCREGVVTKDGRKLVVSESRA